MEKQKLEDKLKEAEKLLGKYIKWNNSYMHVKKVGHSYGSCVLLGPTVTHTENHESHRTLTLPNYTEFHLDTNNMTYFDKYIKIITEEEFREVFNRAIQKFNTMENNCIFCNVDKKDIIFENELAYARYDGFPVNKGHILVIPKRHVASVFDLTKDEFNAIYVLALKAKSIIDDEFHPDGYNVGFNVNEAGGQSVMHVHMHIIPRYNGDVENPCGGIRGVIPTKQNY